MYITFQYKELLWLLLILPIVVAIFFYAKQKKKTALKKIGDAALVSQLTVSYKASSFYKKFLFLFFALALVLLSIANLRTPNGGEKLTRNGIDIMIALDVSKSMLAQDVKPNRLTRAKQLLNKLIDKLSNDRIGIIVFAGRAYLQMPLTADHSATKMYLSAATPETVPAQGTVIADALKSCNAAFNEKDKKYKAVILISDGEDHDENAISTAEKMAQQGVVINTIGIGSPEGSQIIDELTSEPKKDIDGNIVITKLNEETLTEIAKKGNGKYQLYSNTDAVANILFNELAGLDKRTVTDETSINYKSWFQYLLGIAFILLLLELFVSEIKKTNTTKMKILLSVICIFFSITSFAQADNAAIKKGNDAYESNEFENAINAYSGLIKKNNNSTAQYNLGNALYKNKKNEEAIEAYNKAASSLVKPTEKGNALYNKGVVLQNDKKLPESIDAYKNALKQDPNNADARHNLQLALKQQQQKKEQEQKDKKENKKDDKKESKDKEKKDKDKQQQDKKEDETPKQNKSNITKKEAEQKLQALLQKEKELQDKLHKINAASPNKQDKDW